MLSIYKGTLMSGNLYNFSQNHKWWHCRKKSEDDQSQTPPASILKLKSNLLHLTGDGGRDVSFGGHTASAGRAEMPGHVSLHGRGFLLAARERGEETADCGAQGDHLRAAGGAEEPPAPHQSPGAAGEIFHIDLADLGQLSATILSTALRDLL